jgi:hypothetical protein
LWVNWLNSLRAVPDNLPPDEAEATREVMAELLTSRGWLRICAIMRQEREAILAAAKTGHMEAPEAIARIAGIDLWMEGPVAAHAEAQETIEAVVEAAREEEQWSSPVDLEETAPVTNLFGG